LAPEVAANPGTRVIVVENGSGDESATKIGSAIAVSGWENWCTLLVSERNRGFAAGNNFGIAHVMSAEVPDYVLLLNSDTIVQPGCLAHSLGVMIGDSTIGAMSCRLLNADGTIQNVCRRFPTPARCLAAALSLPWWLPGLFSWADCEDLGWDRNRVARDVDWIGGAFMLLRGDWIVRHKGLDERFFFYGEDIELCHRIRETGYRCHYDPGSTVIHYGGSSSDPTRMAASSRNFHSWRGRYLIQRICYGRFAELFIKCADIITVARRVAWRYVMRRRAVQDNLATADVLRFLIRNWNKWDERGA